MTAVLERRYLSVQRQHNLAPPQQPESVNSATELEQLRLQLQAALGEIDRLQQNLSQNETDLKLANTTSASQTHEMQQLTNRIAADAAELLASNTLIGHQSAELLANNATILNQSAELDIARKALTLQSELEAANKELETFSYSVSHDLRSPLRAINGFAKALIEDYGPSLPPEAMRYLEHIESSAIRMGALIDDLLSFSRLSRLDLTTSVLDIAPMANAVWSEIARENPERTIEFDCANNLPKIQADRALMRQVLFNLFSNAAKFTAPRAVAHVSLTGSIMENNVVFVVKDDGVGFDKRYADKLFGPFQRLHKAKDFPGTGIGLALVQRIIHRHGGKVWAESEIDKGAAFYFSLPMEHISA